MLSPPPREIGVSLMVGPERAVAEEVVALLKYEGAGQIWHMANDRLVLLEHALRKVGAGEA